MSQTQNNRGIVVIISGPSGVGKSTICKEIVNRLDDACLSVSVTTRPKTETETDGQDYWFISKEEFQERIKKGMFLEYAEVFGNLYGTPKDKITETVKAGKTAILEIDVQGAQQAKAVFTDAVMIFILPPSAKVLAERLNHRGRDSQEVAEERLGGAGIEIAAGWQHYENMVINEDLDHAVNECIQIIEKTKNKKA
jgi:guanylate kinase